MSLIRARVHRRYKAPIVSIVPYLTEFENRMYTQGAILGDALVAGGGINDVFYDSQYVFLQMENYSGNQEPWLTYANKGSQIYSDWLLGLPTAYNTNGYTRFPWGFYKSFVTHSIASAKTHLVNLSVKGAYANIAVTSQANRDLWQQQGYSRPIAYVLQNLMAAEKVGEARNTFTVDYCVDTCKYHITEWTTGIYINTAPEWRFCQAFMAGITMTALIDYYERSVELGSPDLTIEPVIKTMCDWLWVNMWVADVGGSSPSWTDTGGTGFGAFRYVLFEDQAAADLAGQTVGGPEPAPVLNNLISNSYAWLFKQGAGTLYRDRADDVFSGNVNLITSFSGGKQFNQSHKEVFNYLLWRQG